ncbi:MAG: hypothetical protein WBF51_04425 [Candidatus Dormiibacterota bacterium]
MDAAKAWASSAPRASHSSIQSLTFEYASKIARDWNTKDAASGYVGFVARFWVDTEFLSRYDVHQVGDRTRTEYWIPAGDLDEFNSHIVGPIEFVAKYQRHTKHVRGRP